MSLLGLMRWEEWDLIKELGRRDWESEPVDDLVTTLELAAAVPQGLARVGDIGTYRARLYWDWIVADSGDETDISPNGEYDERKISVDDRNGASSAIMRPDTESAG